MKMTLDEAIAHAKELSENQSMCVDCREEHKQLAEWLEELKQYKEKNQPEKTAEEMFKELDYKCKYSKQRISYAKTVYRNTTLIVFDLKAKQAYCECGMGLRVFSPDESKAVQQQKKELGWI